MKTKHFKTEFLSNLESAILNFAFGKERTENQNVEELLKVTEKDGKFELVNGTRLCRALQNVCLPRLYNTLVNAVLEEKGIKDANATATDATAKGLTEGITRSLSKFYAEAKRKEEIIASEKEKIESYTATLTMMQECGVTDKKALNVLKDKISLHQKNIAELEAKAN